ncbi:MAG: 1-(5-phosphoribosyl)-5-[Bacteroidaceae bacterium]|nr:1-(5-phosphoribosyl)-5-[(5-phosphoribosylamino)methylideneamino]imidazole-4-carboxamide isomerase [Bacteroidaceae bacterium]
MIELIPAIDIIGGRCVRLSQGDYERQTTYDAEPADMVKRFADCGVKRVHVVDLDGAKAAQPENLPTLEKMAGIDGVSIEWGGGLKTETAVRQVFDAGAAYAIVGSVAAKQPDLFTTWLNAFGAERMVLGADVREGKVSVSGWQEDLNLGIEALIDTFQPHGLRQVICTDISRDGMLQGPSFDLYTQLQTAYPDIDFTVSGGISSMDDIRRLNSLNLRKVIIGKAIYEGRISLKEIETYIITQ